MVAFQHGQVRAATISSPPLPRVLDIARPLADFRDYPYQELCVIVRAGNLTGPKAPILKAFVEADRKLNSGDAFAIQVTKASFPELSDDLVGELVADGIHKYRPFPEEGSVSRDSIANVVTTQLRTQAIAQPVSYEDVVDTSLLR